MKLLNQKQVAAQFKVSVTTITNWVRAGDLEAATPYPYYFKHAEVKRFGDSLGVTSTRLQNGSNKAQSVNSFLPSEYAENTNLIRSNGGNS